MRANVLNKLIPALALLFGIGIATSTALMSFSSILLMLSAFFIDDFATKLKKSLANKFILMSSLFFGLFILGCLWSNVPLVQSLKMLSRLIAYGAAPLLFLALLEGSHAAKLLLKGFVLGALFSALCSILAWLFKHPILQGTSDGLTDGAWFKWTVFRGHLLHDAFLAVAANFILAWLVYASNLSRSGKIFWLLAYGLCLVDSMFLVQGRTGQIMFLMMSMLVLIYRFRLKGLLYGLISAGLILPLLFWSAPALKNGVNEFRSEQVQLEQGNYNTSAGLRHQFHEQSLALIKQRLLFGYGSGSFAANYARQVADSNFIRTKNPHGDLYLIGVELGLLGLTGFVLLLAANCYELLKPGDPLYSCLGFTLLFGYLIALTQNSFFMDNVTGLAYLLLMLSILVEIGQAKHV